MKQRVRLRHSFVETIPDVLEPDVLYVSLRYRTVVHLCPSGCGEEVVTPLGRDDWTLVFDGSVSLRPSVGNWGLACRSHYWIERDEVVWAREWSREEIALGHEVASRPLPASARPTWRDRIRAWLRGSRDEAEPGRPRSELNGR